MKADQVAQPEPSAAFAALRRLSPKVTGGLLRMRQEAYRDGVVPGKYKLMTAVAISIALRCKPCIRAYVKLAREKGISQEELIEFLEVAMTMQGCPGEEWALEAYAAYKDFSDDDPHPAEGACCPNETAANVSKRGDTP